MQDTKCPHRGLKYPVSSPVPEPQGDSASPVAGGQTAGANEKRRGARGRSTAVLVGGLTAAEEAAQGLKAGGRVVLGRPRVEGAPGRQVVAAWRAVRGPLDQVAECLDDPVRRHVAKTEAAHPGSVDQPAGIVRL